MAATHKTDQKSPDSTSLAANIGLSGNRVISQFDLAVISAQRTATSVNRHDL